MADKVVNQHTVSQSYLRFFANQQEQTVVFDKLQKKTFSTNVRNVASGRYFYDFPKEALPQDENGQELPEQLVEKFFSEIEGEYPKKFNKIISAYNLGNPEKLYKQPVLTKEDREELSVLMTLQVLRTKEFRAELVQGREKLMKALLDRFIQEDDPGFDVNSYKLQLKKEFLPLLQAEQLANPKFLIEMSQTLMNHVWMIMVNLTNLPFYTSDTPIVKKGNIEHPYMSYSGYASEGIEIYYPLTSKFALSLADRRYFKDLELFENRFYPLKDEENIKYLNGLQISQAYRQVFCIENKFDMAFDYCKQFPDACIEDKSRVSVFAFGREY